jgi:hypothetical protein
MRTAKTSPKRNAKGRSARRYACPNPGKPLGVAATVRRALKDPNFARFLRYLICRAHENDAEAIACLDSYYDGPTTKELDQLCISRKDRPNCLRCTDKTHFIAGVVLYGEATKRKKKKV